MAVDMSLGIIRDCFPTVKGETKKDPFPEAGAVQAASDALLIDARTLWCCLQAAHAAGQLIPPPVGADPADPGLDVVWGPMLPRRGGGCAGWEWQFTVEAPACCWDAPPLVGTGS